MDTPFENVDATVAASTPLPLERIEGDQLRPGRVVIFKTGAGKLGKLVVVGYAPLKAGRGDSIAEYDLQLRWVLF